MSQGKEIEGEEERENLCTDDSKHGSMKGGLLAMDLGSSSCIYSHSPPPRKIRVGPWDGSTSSRVGGSSGGEPQDADYSVVASLSEELEALILARVPRSEYGKFSIVNKMFLTLVKSGDVYKIRKEIGFKEPSVFMLASGETSWRACDRQFGSCRKLPILPSDICFSSGDKESVCAGTHLIVSGKEYDGVVIWRYELASNKWFKGPNMMNPRCLFASATCGTCAFVAGGIGMESDWKALSSAEKYNPETKSWESLPGMHKKRKLCSGCYMDNKFYVIGGTDEEGKGLTCTEAFDEQRNNWDLIPNMLKDSPVQSSQSPPLVAVVNNELYSLEASSNELKVYIKGSNSWKNLGLVPVRADVARGWGVAFKSLGDELLVIGTSTNSVHGMTIYTCSPEPQADKLHWRAIEGCTNQLSPFILNCCVMVA